MFKCPECGEEIEKLKTQCPHCFEVMDELEILMTRDNDFVKGCPKCHERIEEEEETKVCSACEEEIDEKQFLGIVEKAWECVIRIGDPVYRVMASGEEEAKAEAIQAFFDHHGLSIDVVDAKEVEPDGTDL
jgi:hypothetical protein